MAYMIIMYCDFIFWYRSLNTKVSSEEPLKEPPPVWRAKGTKCYSKDLVLKEHTAFKKSWFFWRREVGFQNADARLQFWADHCPIEPVKEKHVQLTSNVKEQIWVDLQRSVDYFFLDYAVYGFEAGDDEWDQEKVDEECTKSILKFEHVMHLYLSQSGVEYVQGMNSVLFNLFLIMSGGVDHTLCAAKILFAGCGVQDGFANLHANDIRLLTLQQMVSIKLPKLANMVEEPFMLRAYFFNWFLTVFSHTGGLFPQVRARILDGFIVHGNVYLYATALAILELLQPTLLRCDPTEYVQVLRDYPDSIHKINRNHSDIINKADLWMKKLTNNFVQEQEEIAKQRLDDGMLF